MRSAELAELVQVDAEHIIEDSDEGSELTVRLEPAGGRLSRGEVVFLYTLITEMIDSLVAEYHFGRRILRPPRRWPR